jgi:uncharacterized membrane protein
MASSALILSLGFFRNIMKLDTIIILLSVYSGARARGMVRSFLNVC